MPCYGYGKAREKMVKLGMVNDKKNISLLNKNGKFVWKKNIFRLMATICS